MFMRVEYMGESLCLVKVPAVLYVRVCCHIIISGKLLLELILDISFLFNTRLAIVVDQRSRFQGAQVKGPNTRQPLSPAPLCLILPHLPPVQRYHVRL